MRLIPVMLALLLALSPGAVAMQASAPTAPATDAARTTTDAAERTDNDTVEPASNGNTTAVMTLGSDPTRVAFDSPSVSLGDSLTMDRNGFQSKLTVTELDQQWASAETEEQKKQILNRYRYRVENRIISLQAREERATDAFSNGTVSEREYLRTLGHIDAEAQEIEQLIGALSQRSESTSFTIDENSLKGKLVTVKGPVRDRISQVTRGNVSTTEIYVATSDNGIVLSTIVGDTYVREIIRTDKRDSSVTPKLSFLEAQDALLDRYPWAFDNDQGAGTNSFGSTNIISVWVDHPHGRVTAYIDAGTEEVFKEVQHKRLTGENPLPPGPGVVNSSENVTLTVNRTHPGGPLRVKLTNETGAPLRSQITVAGEPVGRTNSNGILWTLGPAEQFEVSATYEGETVNVTATPVDES